MAEDNTPPPCFVCGQRAVAALILDDGAKRAYCRKHLPEEEARALADMIKGLKVER
jgi:hypothetical protein